MQASASSTTCAAPANFLSLPKELRDLIYACVLVDEEYIDLGTWGHHPLSPQLLRTNKTIHNDATEVLYGHNRFDFTNSYSYDLPSFLDQIGPDNAKHIRHIRIDFPTFQSLDPGDVKLADNSFGILEKLKDCCGNLRTLTTSRSSTDLMERMLDSLDHPKVVTEALKLIDTRFRAISSMREKESLAMASCQPSLSQLEPVSSSAFATSSPMPASDPDSSSPLLSIIVEVYEESLNDDIRRKMKGHGWTLDTAEYSNEYDGDTGPSGIDSDSYGWSNSGGNDSDDDDDYDIDNDSDFWRRAGD